MHLVPAHAAPEQLSISIVKAALLLMDDVWILLAEHIAWLAPA
jgi:hypothetical protein